MTDGPETARLYEELTMTMERFSALLARENEAIKAREMTILPSLNEEKTAAARACEATMSALRQTTDNLSCLDEARRRHLHDIGANLAPLVETNVRLLTVAVEAGRRFMTSVAAAAKSVAPGPGVYAHDASTGAAPIRGAPTSVAVSFNQTC